MRDDAVIIAAGLCCPLGETFDLATEAYLAGESATVRERSLVGIDGDAPTIAYVIAAADERDYERRLLHLFQKAFEDCLLRATTLRSAEPKRLGLIVVLPRWLQGQPMAERLSDAFSATPYERITQQRLCFGAQAEALWMIDLARQDIVDNNADIVFVAALDSHIDARLLDRLSVERKLYNADQPHGFIPGEACAVIAVAKRSLRLETSAEILGFGVSKEEVDSTPPAIRGLALGEALRSAAVAVKKFPPQRALADLNGERWRAETYGFGLANLGNELGDVPLDPECYALSMGDVGAAAGGVMVALALGMKPRRRDEEMSEPLKYPTLITATSQRGRSCALILAHARGEMS